MRASRNSAAATYANVSHWSRKIEHERVEVHAWEQPVPGEPRRHAEHDHDAKHADVGERLVEHAVPDEQEADDEERQRRAWHEKERLRVKPRHVREARGEQHLCSSTAPRPP